MKLIHEQLISRICLEGVSWTEFLQSQPIRYRLRRPGVSVILDNILDELNYKTPGYGIRTKRNTNVPDLLKSRRK